MASDPVKSTMKWLGLIIALGTVTGGLVTILGTYVFAQKSEVTRLEKRRIVDKGMDLLWDYRLQKVEVQVQNVDSVARRTDTNVEKLLAVRGIQAAPIAKLKPLPDPPSPESLEAAFAAGAELEAAAANPGE